MKALRKLWRILSESMGEGEYERYCAHLRARHPERQPPTPGEFYRARMEEKYAKPNRCC
jgi:uncharacterized short protein YbdD (DUF466 family)